MKMRDDSGQKHAWLAGGYLPAGKKIAAVITAVMTLAVLILRVALTPRMQDPDTGLFHLSYLIIGLMALTMLAAAAVAERRGAAGRQAADPAVPIRHAGGFGDDHRVGAGRF